MVSSRNVNMRQTPDSSESPGGSKIDVSEHKSFMALARRKVLAVISCALVCLLRSEAWYHRIDTSV